MVSVKSSSRVQLVIPSLTCARRSKISGQIAENFVHNGLMGFSGKIGSLERSRSTDLGGRAKSRFPFSARKAGKFRPAELVTACHRYVTALFWVQKVRQSGQVPDFPKTSFFTEFSVFRPSTAACRGPRS